MRLPGSALVLTAAVLTSGGALAVAGAGAGPDSTSTPPGTTALETTAPQETSVPPEARWRTPGPPPWAGNGREDSSEAAAEAGEQRGRGPDATGPAAYGLCRAWSEQDDPAAKATRVPPFRNLAAAAGGAEKVEEYCAALDVPPEEDDQ